MDFNFQKLSQKELERIKKMAKDPLISDYYDRGMLKWQGMYLSEHTAALKEIETKATTQLFRHPPMHTNTIMKILMQAYMQAREVTIQRGFVDLDKHQELYIIGKINGFNDSSVIINQKEIAIEEIEFVNVSK